MKKYLLASTMMVAVVGFGASTLAAPPVINGSVHPGDKRLNLEISGQFTPTAWAGSQDIEFIPVGTFGFAQNPVAVRPIDKTRGYDFRNYYNRLNFKAYGVADSWDLEYYGRARFVLNGGSKLSQANDTNFVALNPTFIDRLGVNLKGKWGEFEFGDETSRVFKDNHYSGTIMTGIGGWDAYLMGQEFITSVNTINSPFPDQIESNFTKVSYKSPSYYGFSLGATFTPDTSHRGDNPLVEVNGAGGSFENVYDVSVEFKEKFFNDKFGVKALVGWIGGEHEDAVNDVNGPETFTASGELAYEGFQVAGDYADFNKQGISAVGVAAGVDAGHVWDVGAAYRTGAWGIFASYMRTSRNTGNGFDPETDLIVSAPTKAKLWAISAGIEFTLAPGLTTFLEFTHADNNDNTAVSTPFLLPGSGTAVAVRDVTAIPLAFQDNEGDFVVLGTKLKF